MNNSSLKLSAEDETAIRGLVQRMMDGWNALDAHAFAAPFTEDADYVIINGRHVCGRSVIVEGHEEIFSTFYRDSQLETSVYKVRPLQEGIAQVHADAHLRYRLEGAEHEVRGRYGLVCVKNGDDWQIAAFQNTPVAVS